MHYRYMCDKTSNKSLSREFRTLGVY